jgi:hypothetical protein
MPENLMAIWEYKIIGSGKGGFGSPSLLEAHLNQFGKDEWEIIAFATNPDNPLAFTGLARRTTQRDWTLQDAAAAAAKAEAEKLRAEFAAKFQAAQPGAVAEEKPTSLAADPAGAEGDLRSLRDTDRDQDPEALADSDEDDWRKLESEDELPTFFEFIRPHMRRNQRGPGMSLAVDYLANKIDLSPGEVVGALKESGFTIPESEDEDPIYVEYDGDLYWVNANRHRQLFINTKEKPRPVFRVVKAQPVAPAEAPEETKARGEGRESRGRRAEAPVAPAEPSAETPGADSGAEAAAAPAAVPPEAAAVPAAVEGAPTPVAPPAASVLGEGAEALLVKLRPMMRRNRRAPGVSGSAGFLSRALRQSEQEFVAALAAVGFVIPQGSNEKPVFQEAGSWTYWINRDGRGGLWINGRERRGRPGGERSAPESSGAAGDASSEDGAAGVPPTDASAPVAPALESTVPVAEPAASVATDGVSLPAADPAVAQPLVAADVAVSPPPSDTPTPAVEIAPEPAVPAAPSATLSLADVRALLRPKPRGGAQAGINFLEQALNRPAAAILEELVRAGLRVPASADEEPVTVELDDEVLWLGLTPRKGELVLTAKAKGGRRARASGTRRSARKPDEAESEAAAPETSGSTESASPPPAGPA